MLGVPLLLSSSLELFLALNPGYKQYFTDLLRCPSPSKMRSPSGFHPLPQPLGSVTQPLWKAKIKIVTLLCNRGANWFNIKCESTHQKFAMAIFIFNPSKLLSDPFKWQFFFFYFIGIFKSSKTNLGINSFH